mgnify:FL=1
MEPTNDEREIHQAILLDALDRFNDIDGGVMGYTREEKEQRSRDYTLLFNFITK